VTGFLSRGRMGRFDDAVQLVQQTGMPADITAVRQYTSRGGVSVNLEQQVIEGLGLFARAGLADGSIEPYEFTDIDRTVAAGLALNGKRWGRPDDTFGLAGVVNGITSEHQAFLNAGGLGILVGDGRLPNPGAEKILETYYSLSGFYLARDLRLSIRRQPRLQPRPRAGLYYRHAVANPVLSAARRSGGALTAHHHLASLKALSLPDISDLQQDCWPPQQRAFPPQRARGHRCGCTAVTRR
jgi:hypothetical protein